MESPPPIPADEARIQTVLTDPQRLAAVFNTGLLDTPPEEGFDRLTRLAAKLTGAPVTFVSLVDADRDFYKSTFGMSEALNSARELNGRTFCHHVLVSEDALILEDVAQLPVFRDVPAVASLGVRAYAGIPLKTEAGEMLGSFCAVDFQPKQWSKRDIEILVELAHSAMREIRLRKALHEAEVLNQQLLAQVKRVDELNQALSELATTDALTGLNNRRAFDHSLQLEMAVVERRNIPLSLLMLDVDHFKHINDQFGHDAGDKVLIAIAQMLNGCARVVDVVARVGGEEFAVILPNTDADGALEVAERMRTTVAQAKWLAHPATISIGVATLQIKESASRLYSRADAALYDAKATGRNRVVMG
ncbi:MAG: sensor domain-containing diguanylate cyclase [Gammaproteobacteria bacterium]|nr:sensor domain-containing diguanylate cyclase [Gammaproteobacteria bacterium]MBU0892898.1 sensor domain-containing diguanylate cyclase [Gammaproteobacteria bacterium]MBU1815140.1 sensor domain-containing diguanylate cyclase [Gammaproteobacteria bacterium]